MKVLKLMLTYVGIHYRLESCGSFYQVVELYGTTLKRNLHIVFAKNDYSFDSPFTSSNNSILQNACCIIHKFIMVWRRSGHWKNALVFSIPFLFTGMCSANLDCSIQFRDVRIKIGCGHDKETLFFFHFKLRIGKGPQLKDIKVFTNYASWKNLSQDQQEPLILRSDFLFIVVRLYSTQSLS